MEILGGTMKYDYTGLQALIRRFSEYGCHHQMAGEWSLDGNPNGFVLCYKGEEIIRCSDGLISARDVHAEDYRKIFGLLSMFFPWIGPRTAPEEIVA